MAPVNDRYAFFSLLVAFCGCSWPFLLLFGNFVLPLRAHLSLFGTLLVTLVPPSRARIDITYFRGKTLVVNGATGPRKGCQKACPGLLCPFFGRLSGPHWSPTGPPWASLGSLVAPKRGCRTLIRTFIGPVRRP